MNLLDIRSGRTLRWAAGALVTVSITLGFLLLFWNRFVGLRSGDGGFGGALLLFHGIVPYRDFYSAGPPLFLLRTAAVLALFGKTVIAIRAAGVVERVILALLVYAWLARLFKAQNAALAAIITMVASSLDIADPISSYNHFAILTAVAASFLSSYALDEHRSTRVLAAIGAGAGVCSFLSIATKQTIGLAITVALPIILGITLLRLEGVRKSAAYVLGFVLAWISALLVLFAGLARMGILHPFLQQIFVTGPSAKASHAGDFLSRAIFVMSQSPWEVRLALFASIFCIAAVLCSAGNKVAGEESSHSAWLQMIAVLLIGVASLCLALTVPHHIIDDAILFSPIWYHVDANTPLRSLIYLTLFDSAFIGAWYFFRCVRSNCLTRRESQFLLYSAASFCVAFMLSLSFPAFELLILPGLGLLVAAVLENISHWTRWLVYVVCVLLLICEIQKKLDTPFGFAAWSEPSVALATSRSTIPELKGLRLPVSTVKFVDSTVRIIQENSAPTDTIFTYPEFSIFYSLAHRMPATFSGSHNLDLVPDAFARQEAARLLAHPPAVIVYGSESDIFFIGQEVLWRNGMPSGQRAILAAINSLKVRYRLAEKYQPYGRSGYWYVYVRPKDWPPSSLGRAF